MANKHYFQSMLLILLIYLSLMISCLDLQAPISQSIESDYEWGPVYIGGGGFVSGIVVGQNEMYLRTDVGGAYKYDNENK